jgi:hypothetical protein
MKIRPPRLGDAHLHVENCPRAARMTKSRSKSNSGTIILGYELPSLPANIYSPRTSAIPVPEPIKPSPSLLLQLPPELFNHVVSFLDFDSAVALRHSSATLHQLITSHQLRKIRCEFLKCTPVFAQHQPCFTCLQLRPRTRFDMDQPPNYTGERYCMDCGIRTQRYTPGQLLRGFGTSAPHIYCVKCKQTEAPSWYPNRDPRAGYCGKCDWSLADWFGLRRHRFATTMRYLQLTWASAVMAYSIKAIQHDNYGADSLTLRLPLAAVCICFTCVGEICVVRDDGYADLF